MIDISDPEGRTITITSTTLPGFVTISSLTFIFSPDYTLGNSTNVINFTASDGAMTTVECFTLNVFNDEPIFTAESTALIYEIL